MWAARGCCCGKGYEVYRNVSQHGLFDMIAIKDGKPLL